MGASCLGHQKTRLHNLANWLLLAFRRIRNWSIVLLSIQLLQQNRAYKNVVFFFQVSLDRFSYEWSLL